jgi:hypothetical protein
MKRLTAAAFEVSFSQSRTVEIQANGMTDKETEEDFRSFTEHLSKTGNKSHRRYELKGIDGRLMLVRDQVCRAFDIAIAEAFGTDLEPDDKDGIFLD